MAQRVNVILVDDLDGSDADETVEFAFDGAQYEIDLSDVHAKELREFMITYVECARRVGGRATKKKKAAAAPAPTQEATAAEIREWARGAGYEVTDRGRVSAELREAYAAAQ